MLHPDYKNRLHRVWPELTFLEVYRIDVYDLFLNKFNASRAKDYSDMRDLIEKKLVTHEKCSPLFEECLKHWYDGDERLRKEFEKLWL
jgi:L-rhamnose mutarotase